MTTKDSPVYIVLDIPRTHAFFCPPNARPQVELCNFDCPEMRARLSTIARLTDILLDVQRDKCHALGCRYVRSWPFKGKCNCFQSRIEKEFER